MLVKIRGRYTKCVKHSNRKEGFSFPSLTNFESDYPRTLPKTSLEDVTLQVVPALDAGMLRQPQIDPVLLGLDAYLHMLCRLHDENPPHDASHI